MMSPQLLARASDHFRRGYRDARDGRPSKTAMRPGEYTTGTFAQYDYDAGYSAAANELHWERKRKEGQ